MTVAGDCFLRGIFTDKDAEKAHFYYKMAADAGEAKHLLQWPYIFIIKIEKIV